ncbi:E3 ubiquitin-protein ligase rnf168-like isoform X2 [Macrosteles quadrilineatus]|uniref:E3 ubiquitin-protein ligase rnf168-like isoform X2 n=1 Tax=Macrosteles quadrilineatus TaxID=74068 RepID=UPI0023E227B7|nr:E3 ubiquitin-protein ligase rnf168-like isoform X2 [Macrosteles quadrilineatus]
MQNGGTDFECRICFEIFLYPVCLPCKHRFCKACLDKHIDNNNMCCPICRYRVSNWLRQLRRNNADIVDKPFWEKVQKIYPLEARKRINGKIDYESSLIHYWERLSSINETEKKRSTTVHKALLDAGQIRREWNEDWRGWSEPVYQNCRNILRSVINYPNNQSSLQDSEIPIRRLAKPGEIHKEYEEFLQKESEEKRKKDEENFRLSQHMIKMIEEDERREIEERLQQERLDEELAKKIAQEAPSTGDTVDKILLDDASSPSGSCTPQKSFSLEKCLNTPSTSKDGSLPCLGATPSTSKDNIFSMFRTSTPPSKRSSHTSSLHQEPSTSTDSKTSISNQALSHFAPVLPGPSNDARDKKMKEMPSTSRCSSGSDSIGQELNHFKPIRTSPTTPPKAGSRRLWPRVVIPKLGTESKINILPLSHLDILAANVSLDELETSINLEKQLEEDREFAKKIQKQFDQEMKMSVKTDYNLRKRKRPSGNAKKKVSLDRSQTTLDNLLIK